MSSTQIHSMKKVVFSVFIGIVAVVSFSGCLKNSDDGYTQTCSYDSCALKAPSSEIQVIQKYLADSGLTATQTCSGAFYNIISQGTGAAPTPCSYITAKYVGKLADGSKFDSTETGATFSSYLGNLVRGWVNTLPYLKAGGKIRMYIPPTIGYGSVERKNNAGVVVIPANSMLVFDVDLVTVQ